MVTSALLFWMCIIFIGSLTSAHSCSISAEEFHGLELLFNATNGIHWNWGFSLSTDTRWTFPGDPSVPCSKNWQGLECVQMSNNSCAVAGVRLVNQKLAGTDILYCFVDGSLIIAPSGTFPNDLHLLKFVKAFDFSYNSIQGSVPCSVGAIANMSYLNIAHNMLSGVIPPSLGNLSALTLLDLSHNVFQPSIPTSLAQLSYLSTLRLSGYKSASSSAVLPAALSLLSELVILDLSQNYFTGSFPSFILHNVKLQQLKISSNSFMGSIPHDIGNLKLLQQLDASSNHFAGPLPYSIGNLTDLQLMDFAFNQLTSVIPSTVGLMTSLTTLRIKYQKLSGSLPSSLGLLLSLTDLELLSNKLTGNLPSSLWSLTNLRFLDLSSNHWTGTLSTNIGNVRYLQTLRITTSNAIRGGIPSSLGQLTALTELKLSGVDSTGVAPTWLASLTNLQTLSLRSTKLAGKMSSLYEFIAHTTKLGYLDLSNNSISGSIPYSLGLLSQLNTLYLYQNSITGSIPSSFGLLTQLQYLDCRQNAISGTLPSSIALLTHLAYFSVQFNRMSGSILSSFGQLTKLYLLCLSSNGFTGTLPSSYGLLSMLLYLDVGYNKLSGTVPSSIVIIPVLEYLFLNHNNLEGSLPVTWNAPILWQCELNDNYFAGTVPSSLAVSNQLAFLNINDNYFSMSLSMFEPSTSLMVLNLSSNHFSGHIQNLPSVLGWLDVSFNLFTGIFPTLPSYLKFISVSSNQIHGNLPENYSRVLSGLFVADNHLTSSIPQSFGDLTALSLIDLSSNEFSGTLPMFVSESVVKFVVNNNNIGGLLPDLPWTQCILLNVKDNLFTGTIPEAYGHNMTQLQQFHGSNNMLVGSIPNDLVNLPSLKVLDLHSNILIGQIPDKFGPSSLVSFNVENNCLSQTLPSGYCNSLQLQYFVVDGASSSQHCQRYLMVGLQHLGLKGMTSQRSLTSTIPSCYCDMPNLEYLHLGANSFTGTLCDVIANSSIVSLVMSYNKLTGTIPLSIQHFGRFDVLGLSHNRFSGSLASSFTVNQNTSVLNISMNHLSGAVPNSLASLKSVDVLEGNVFDCKSAASLSNDVYASQYSCGSSHLDTSIYVAVVFLGLSWVVLIAMLFVDRFQKSKIRITTSWAAFRHHKIMPGFTETMWRFCVLVVLFTGINLVVGLSSYVIFKNMVSSDGVFKYSTHSSQFGWITTAAFLFGTGPLIIIALIVVIEICFIVYLSETQSRKVEYIQHNARNRSLKQSMKIIGLQILNAFVSLTFNGSYVVMAYRNYNSSSVTSVQALMGLAKLVWSIIVSQLLTWCEFGEETFVTSQRLIIFLVNFVLVPLVVTLLTDGNCFYYALLGSPTIDITTPEVNSVVNLMLHYVIGSYSFDFSYYADYVAPKASISVEPAWAYSHQCTSALITNYVPVLMYSYTISGVLMPFLNVLFISAPTLLTGLDKWLTIANPMSGNLIFEAAAQSMSYRPTYSSNVNLFDASQELSNVLVHVTVLMTFGLASPVLGVMITACIVGSVISLFLACGCYLHNASDIAANSTALEKCVGNVTTDLKACLPIILSMVMLFWTTLFVDMALSSYDLSKSLIIGGVLGVVAPLLCIGCLLFWSCFSNRVRSQVSVLPATGAIATAAALELDDTHVQLQLLIRRHVEVSTEKEAAVVDMEEGRRQVGGGHEDKQHDGQQEEVPQQEKECEEEDIKINIDGIDG